MREDELVTWYRRNGIHSYVRMPISDDDEAACSKDMFEAQKVLAEWILKQNHRVYLHDTAGVTRCASLADVYLCLNMKSQNWKKPDEVRRNIEEQHFPAKLNMPLVHRCIEEHLFYRKNI